jgi:hypothetical protein
MTCDCAEQIDVLLKPRGESLNIAFSVKDGGKTKEYYIVSVTKILGGRGRTTLLLAKYCPFCWKEQEK